MLSVIVAAGGGLVSGRANALKAAKPTGTRSASFNRAQLFDFFLSSTYKCNFLGADNKQ